MCIRLNGGPARWTALVLGALVWLCPGCDSKLVKEFREASRTQLETGVNSVIDGVVTGAFTLWDPDSSTSSDTTGG